MRSPAGPYKRDILINPTVLKMLLKSYEMTEQLYNPLNHLTQTELMEKFNLAFYEAQNLSKNDIISTFNENIPETTYINEEEADQNDDFLIDYLISNSDDTPASTPNSEVDVNFDFNDFVVDFDQNVSQNGDQTDLSGDNFDTETFTTENSQSETSFGADFSQFYVAPPFSVEKSDDKSSTENIDFINIDICDELRGSLDFGEFPADFQELEESNGVEFDDSGSFLPPVGTITKNNMDFNNFIRRVPANTVSYLNQDCQIKNEFGHLIGIKCLNNNFNSSIEEKTTIATEDLFNIQEDNQMILTQNEALLNDDPLLSSSSNVMFPMRKRREYLEKKDEDGSENQIEEVSSSRSFLCKWEMCYQFYDSQTSLVKHIEKCHVELKRGEEFTCFWDDCPRKTKPFNARYKLLIHMRVHSGEKPNKCPFKGCDKAFSRLENLKIHQRSHTGERPYLCQFSSCTKSFSNSSDRAKHQRTHFDTKPYACQVTGCLKKYTDPSSLRKHVKNHTYEEQMQIKRKTSEEGTNFIAQSLTKKYLDPSRQKAVRQMNYEANFDHSYSNNFFTEKKYDSANVKQDLKNKLLSDKGKLRKLCY
ncbi:hypothetical protein JTB14_036012 [Gonioctena quinquepunctata]|nr:hypothetical protein JTB14_036012 [Gonioctena quinquepunctata]